MTKCEPLPQHWPLLALNTADMNDTDAVVVEMVRKLEEQSIKVLVVQKNAQETTTSVSGALPVRCRGVDTVFIDHCSTLSTKVAIEETVAPYITKYDAIFLLSKRILPIDTIRLTDDTLQDDENTLYCHQQIDDINGLVSFILRWLQQKVEIAPIRACVLIGGKSTRMGRPKHLIEASNGRTWLENTVAKLHNVAIEVVLSGTGEIPDSLVFLKRLTDIDNVKGPLTGIISAMRWNPQASWLLVACDMPDINEEALHWLLSTRKTGVWGTVPRHRESGYYEPLLAHYDFRCAKLFEKLVTAHCRRISEICKESKVATPFIPSGLSNCWKNCNTPEALNELGI